MLACSFVLAIAVVASPALAAKKKPKAPAGAVAVSIFKTKKVGKIQCAEVKGSWVSGVLVKGKAGRNLRYFRPDTASATAAARKARTSKGAARKRLQRQAAKWRKAAKTGLVMCAPVPAPTRGSLQFDFRGAVGAALRGKGSAERLGQGKRQAQISDSDLAAILPSGELRNAITRNPGSNIGAISTIFAGPGNYLYIVFSPAMPLTRVPVSDAVPLQPDPTDCVLARVARDATTPTCIQEKTAAGLSIYRPGASAVSQFRASADGAVYYLAQPASAGQRAEYIYRWKDGASGPITPALSINNWAVLTDGSVVVNSSATPSPQLTRYSPAGAAEDLGTPMGSFLSVFPDGALYAGRTPGQAPGASSGLAKFTSGAFESRWWICTANCNGQDAAHTAEVGTPLNGVTGGRETATTTGGSVFTAGNATSPSQRPLLKVWPTPEAVNTAISYVGTFEAAGGSVLVAGKNASGQNMLVRIPEGGGPESVIVGPAENVEIQFLDYSPSRNIALFNGYRPAEGQWVVGQVDLGSGAVSYSKSGTAPFGAQAAFD